MQNFFNPNETLLLLANNPQIGQCDCQSSENSAAEAGAESVNDYTAGQAPGQCVNGVCALNWKPARPAA